MDSPSERRDGPGQQWRLIAAVLCFSAGITLRSAAAAAAPGFALVPDATTVAVGQEVKVEIRLADPGGILGADVRFTFDPTILSATAVRLTDGGLIQGITGTNTIDNATGRVRFSKAGATPVDCGGTCAKPLASITFQALRAGVVTFVLPAYDASSSDPWVSGPWLVDANYGAVKVFSTQTATITVAAAGADATRGAATGAEDGAGSSAPNPPDGAAGSQTGSNPADGGARNLGNASGSEGDAGVGPAAGPPGAKAGVFPDLVSHWVREDAAVLASRGILSGGADGRFDPERPVTRAEMVKMLVLMLAGDLPRGAGVDAPTRPTFRDVTPGAWYFSYVETAVRYGLVKGQGGRFRPGDPITREEMAAMVVRALGLGEEARPAGEGPLPFRDAAAISPWARGEVVLAHRLGLVKGLGANAFAPAGRATRAQAAAVVRRALERLGQAGIPPRAAGPVTVTGTVSVAQIEGRHLELEVAAGGAVTRYVLVPADAVVERLLEAGVGSRVRVTGTVDDGPSIYMRGPVLRVTRVLPGG